MSYFFFTLKYAYLFLFSNLIVAVKSIFSLNFQKVLLGL